MGTGARYGWVPGIRRGDLGFGSDTGHMSKNGGVGQGGNFPALFRRQRHMTGSCTVVRIRRDVVASTFRRRLRLLCLTALCFVVASCSDSPIEADNAASGPLLSCDSEFSEILETLGGGESRPLLDYDVAEDLETLVGRSELVIQGTVTSVRHELIGDSPEEDVAVVSFSEATVLHSTDPDAVSPESFAVSLFATGGDAEFDATDVEGVEFIAVLRSATADVMVAELQGLAISCSGSTDPAVPVIELLPADIRTLTIDEIAEEVLAT